MFNKLVPSVKINKDITDAKIDLISFADLRLFMFETDNLYIIGVPEGNRHFSIQDHYKNVEINGYQKCSIDVSSLHTIDEPKFFFYKYLTYLCSLNRQPVLLDIGAFVGDFSLALANFCRTSNLPFKSICFDPSIVGSLIPFNIEINGLENYIRHENLAVSGFNGPVKFNFRIGHLDSASICDKSNAGYDYLVRSTKISSFLQKSGFKDETLIVKIDTEGYEAEIIKDLFSASKLLPTVVFEFSPDNFSAKGYDPSAFLSEQQKDFFVYDVSHLPWPSRFRPVKPGHEAKFVDQVKKRASGYADIILMPKDLPNIKIFLDNNESLVFQREGLYNFVGTLLCGHD